MADLESHAAKWLIFLSGFKLNFAFLARQLWKSPLWISRKSVLCLPRW